MTVGLHCPCKVFPDGEVYPESKAPGNEKMLEKVESIDWYASTRKLIYECRLCGSRWAFKSQYHPGTGYDCEWLGPQ